jgi:hypothetical protein
MAENAWAETIIPGTYVRVLSEGLISVGGISTGTVGIVGSASAGFDTTWLLGDYGSAQAAFGAYDAYDNGAGTLNLTRALEVLFRNGARQVVARAVAAGAAQNVYEAAFDEVLKEDVNILIAPEQPLAAALAVLGPKASGGEDTGRDVIAVVGADPVAVNQMITDDQVPNSGRIILTTPGIRAFDAIDKEEVSLDGRYSAAAVAGLLSSLSPESSPTNKTLPGVVGLAHRHSYAELKRLVQNRVLALEERQGVRVVRGVTTDEGAFAQVTTRRITDFAKAGVRKAAGPFIGRLNNERVRGALRGAIDGFLTNMVVAEQLTAYTLEVTATRQDEIAGRALVNVMLQPTFSIDYVMVTLVLQ